MRVRVGERRRTRRAAVLLATLALVGACGSSMTPTAMTASPTAAPTPLASTAASPSAAPSSSSPEAAAIPGLVTREFDHPIIGPGDPSAAAGTRFYHASPDGSALVALDWTTGASLTLVRLPASHRVSRIAAAGGWVVFVDVHLLGPPGIQGTPCNSAAAEPFAWRIVGIELATGHQTTFDNGLNRRTTPIPGYNEICPGPVVPFLALDGTRLAYDREAPTAADALAERILVRRLADGRLLREVSTRGALGSVTPLAVAGDTLAFSEALASVGARRTQLMLSTGAQPAGVVVATGPGSLTLADGRLAWDQIGADGIPRVWTKTLPDGVPEPIGAPRGEVPTVRGSAVAWGYEEPDGSAGLAIWSAATGQVEYLPLTFIPNRVWITEAGWLVWMGEGLNSQGGAVMFLCAAPVAGLVG